MSDDIKTLTGQIEFLKEYNARLKDNNDQAHRKIHNLNATVMKLLNQIDELKAENMRLADENAIKDAEIRKLHQNLEISQEYNKRLSDKMNMLRDMTSRLRL